MNDFEVVKRMCEKHDGCTGCLFSTGKVRYCSVIKCPARFNISEMSKRLEKAREMLQEEMYSD